MLIVVLSMILTNPTPVVPSDCGEIVIGGAKFTALSEFVRDENLSDDANLVCRKGGNTDGERNEIISVSVKGADFSVENHLAPVFSPICTAIRCDLAVYSDRGDEIVSYLFVEKDRLIQIIVHTEESKAAMRQLVESFCSADNEHLP